MFDIMHLPQTKDHNKHVLVLQEFLTKWPMVYPMPDTKKVRILKILDKEFMTFGVTKTLLSDRGTNLQSYVFDEWDQKTKYNCLSPGMQ